jgi:hypothetical protein
MMEDAGSHKIYVKNIQKIKRQFLPIFGLDCSPVIPIEIAFTTEFCGVRNITVRANWCCLDLFY